MVGNLLGDQIILRPGQANAVKGILAAREAGVKTVFLDAPVGSGKSLVNLLVAHELRGAYISTPQVILVNQYGADTSRDGKFAGLAATLYGRRNYPCEFQRSLPAEEGGRPNATAAGAPCTFLAGWPRECPSLTSCEYYSAKALAQEHRQTVTTLAYLLTGIRLGLLQPSSGWVCRPLLVIDEAHNFAEDLVRFFQTEIGPKTLPGFRKKWLDSPADPRFRLLDTLPAYVDRLREVLGSLQQSGTPSRKIRERIERLSNVCNLADDLVSKLRIGTVEWIHSHDSRSGLHKWVPLAVHSMLRDFWKQFDLILLSSATFFGIDTLVDDTGLPTPIQRVVVADSFPAARAPVRLLSAARLGFRVDPLEIERAADAVSAVALAHPTERGVIHANSYYLARSILKFLPKEVRRRLVSHDRGNRTARFVRWRADPSRNSIFLAIAMTQGVDLVGDVARWQVVVKVPFPDLGDNWVRRRIEQTDGQRWYVNRTLIEILQASGRIMRSSIDSGITYIVDTQIDSLLDSEWLYLPEWFRNRVIAGRKPDRPLPGKFADYSIRSPRNG